MNQENGSKQGENSINGTPKEDKKITFRDFISEIVRFTIISVLIVAPIRIFIAQPFMVSGGSMDPTFTNGDYLVIDELSYYFENPQRGEIIVFRYPKDTSKFFIKRIVGMPGETLNISPNNISVKSKDGDVVMNEPYVKNPDLFGRNMEVTLGPDEYFVMGDNRGASSDSREWGSLKKQLITGRVLFRLLPITHAGFQPGKYVGNIISSSEINK
ncbi:MAG: signal peptidase I [Candidatus Paceibacterota bacterium]|jgi:signal peptidase I